MPPLTFPHVTAPIATNGGLLQMVWYRFLASIIGSPGVLYDYASELYADPNTFVEAPTGATYRNLQGGASVTLWVKESSPTPTTGWVAK